MRSHLHLVTADAHAAPLAGMVLRRIVKKQDAGLIPALLYETEIFGAQQVACGFGHKCQELSVASRRRIEVTFNSAGRTKELWIAWALAEHPVDCFDH
jgi:hypothetical protein